MIFEITQVKNTISKTIIDSKAMAYLKDGINFYNLGNPKSAYEIHQVKRLKDGVLFTVGDLVSAKLVGHQNIEKFKYDESYNDKLIVYFKNNTMGLEILNYLTLVETTNALINKNTMNSKTLVEVTNIDKQIAELHKRKQQLLRENTLTHKIEEHIRKGGSRWVIENGRKYFEYAETTGAITSLMRNGKRHQITNTAFEKDFKIATPDEVKQHEEFLLSHMFRIRPNTLINPSVINNLGFYMVTCTGEHGSKVRHVTYGAALKEAARVSLLKNHTAFVLGVVATVEHK